MALFNKLLNLHSDERNATEDFFTEIFAALVRADEHLLLKWLSLCGVSCVAGRKAVISTQYLHQKLPAHDANSKIDLVIFLSSRDPEANELPDLVFIESKLDSEEGVEQLPRYYDHLCQALGYRNKWLVYVTKKHDPKEPHDFPAVQFRQSRWHVFYNLLKSHPSNQLSLEAMRFMEAHQMAQGNRFTPLDVLIMRNMRGTINLMQHALEGEVLEKFKLVAKCNTPDAATTFRVLKESGRYVLEWWRRDGSAGFQVGFMPPFNNDDIASYPVVMAGLTIGPKNPAHQALRSAMKTSCRSDLEWKSWNLDTDEKYFSIWVEKSLTSFLDEEDHVTAMQKFLVRSLVKIDEWLSSQPYLVPSE